MALSRCKVFSRENLRCLQTAEHSGRHHSFGARAPGPPDPPPSPLDGERYETDEEFWRRRQRCFACASDVHSKCSGEPYCQCGCSNRDD